MRLETDRMNACVGIGLRERRPSRSQIHLVLDLLGNSLAERVGFEPTWECNPLPDFESGPL